MEKAISTLPGRPNVQKIGQKNMLFLAIFILKIKNKKRKHWKVLIKHFIPFDLILS